MSKKASYSFGTDADDPYKTGAGGVSGSWKLCRRRLCGLGDCAT